jgi:hypothetical protein
MANTVTTLNYANTFGDWLVATDALISENNILATGDYTKPSGTLFLNETTQNALFANGSVVVQKQLLVQGSGSSTTMDKNLTVGGQVYFTNTTLGLTHSGQANLNGLVLVQGPGVAIEVSNNAYVGGNTTVRYNTITNNVQANSSVNTSNASVVGTVYTKTLQANTNANTRTLSVTGTSYTNYLEANTTVNTSTISVSSTTHTNTLQANTSVLTATLTANTLVNAANVITGTLSSPGTITVSEVQANNSVYANNIVANNSVIGSSFISNNSMSATNTMFANVVQANVSVTTGTVTANTLINAANIVSSGSISANNDVIANRIQANTVATVGSLSANNLVIASNFVSNGSMSASSTIFANRLQANSTINTAFGYADVWQGNVRVTTDNLVSNVASISGSHFANTITGNTSITTPLLTVSSVLNGNAAVGYFSTIQTSGKLSVGGDFVINGTTVYNSNTLTLSAASNNEISYFSVYRAGANAAIRWNEPQLYWDILNVNNLNYYRILTNEQLNDTITSTSSSLVATANSVNAVSLRAASAGLYANGAFAQANAAFASANNVAPQIQPAFNQANSAFAQANAASSRANTSANTIVGTVGSVTANSGVVSFTSNNGVAIVATSANNLAISTSQDLRTTATPTFAGLTLSAPLPLSEGGTGQTNASDALTALLPTGTTSGYVLTTGGPGNFYWSASGGGGSGATPGTTINSTRLSYTANGAAGFTGNTYTTPTFTTSTQVRAYINGVRQFESEYTLNQAANNISFKTTPTLNDSILVEVDGYFVNPYYANNIAYTINNNISPTANTIQLAIDGLTSKVTTYYANLSSTSAQAFDGVVTGKTMAAGTSNTAFATTAYVQTLVNGGNTLTANVTGNAGTVTNGVYTNGSYANPSWITSLANTKITGTFAVGSITGLAASATTDTTNANNITSGTLATARLPVSGVTATSTGSATSTTRLTIDTYGRITSANSVAIAISSGAVSGLAASATTDTTNANNITSGTLNSSRLPSISAGLITGLAASATTDTTSATNITSGTLSALRLPFTMDQSVSTTNDVRFNSLGVGTAASGTAGEIRATNEITAYYSDERLKTNLGNIENALNKVTSLNGFYYEPNETAQALGYEVKRQVGVSAQEVYKVLPEVTAPAPIDEQYLTVHYDKLVPLLIEAIKELKAEVEALKGNNK